MDSVNRVKNLLELGGATPQERDWKGIGTALLVIMIICSIIFFAGYFFTPLTANDHLLRPKVTYSQLLKRISRFRSVEFISDDVILIDNGSLNVVNIKTNETRKAFERDPVASSIVKSSSLKYVVRKEVVPSPSRNPDEEAFVATIVDAQGSEYRVGVERSKRELLKVFKWNTEGSDYAFVEGDHIYYTSSPESPESIRVSSNEGNKTHGFFDWMYEEEIYDTRDALWWSIKGERLAFASLDSKSYKDVTMTRFDSQSNYPIDSSLPYPKVGERRLPVYSISIWDKKERLSKTMDVQLRESNEFHYLFSVNWVELEGKEVAVAIWTNRYQNKMSITLCDYTTGICQLVADQDYPKKTWALPADFKNILYSNDSLFMLFPHRYSDDNSYQHIAKFTLKQDHTKRIRWATPHFLPAGPYDVSELLSYDAERNLVYYHAWYPNSETLSTLVTSSYPSSSGEGRCLTCDTDVWKSCSSQHTSFNKEMDKMAVVCKGDYGWIAVADIEVHNKHDKVRVDNVREIVAHKNNDSMFNEPVVIKETIALSDGYEAITQLTIPADQMNKAHGRSLPLLVYVYAGPGFKLIFDYPQYSRMYADVANGEYAMLKIDARGSGNRGWKYRSPIYGALGTVEMEDQLEATRKILKKHPYLDSSRVAVYGWSYGGFASANMVIMASDGFFKCSISGAPVSNFLYYDAAYTERYMGDASKEAYNRADISRNVAKFNQTRLLLMHGLFDDNVHFQNSALFIEKMQMANVDFELMVYPNQNHGIVERESHKSMIISKFLDKCFQH